MAEEDAFLKDLGRDDAAKKEADVMDFIRSQQSNDGRADEDDDWDDALALRSFLKLPKHAKESLTQGTGGASRQPRSCPPQTREEYGTVC